MHLGCGIRLRHGTNFNLNKLIMLNYEKLTAFNPTIYGEFTNRLGQKVRFVEHPTKGDESEVIAMFLDFGKAFYSNFFELGEIDELNGEYEVLLVDGELVHGWEL